MFGLLLITAVVVFITYIVTAMKRKNDYFKKHNIPHIPWDWKRVKNTYKALSLKRHMLDVVLDYYSTHPGSRYVAFDSYGMNIFMVKDLDMANKILIKDFDHFIDRNSVDANKTDKVMSNMLTSLTGHQWKNVRSAVSPTFTSKKIKIMSELVSNTTKSLNLLLRKKAEDKEEVDVKDLFTMTATDAIAASIFGLDIKCLEGNTTFKEMVIKLTDFKMTNIIFHLMSPKLAQLLNIHIIDPTAKKYFADVTDKAVEGRRKQNVVGMDFVQQMVDVKENSDDLQDDINEDDDARLNHKANIKEGKDDYEIIRHQPALSLHSITFSFVSIKYNCNFNFSTYDGDDGCAGTFVPFCWL